MVRRLIVFTLMLVTVAGLVFGAGSQETATDTSGERVDLEILIWWAKKFADNDALIEKIGDEVNANLTIATIPHNVYFDQITTKIAANDLPVMYKLQIPGTNGFRQMYDLIEDGMLTPLDEVALEHGLQDWDAYLSRAELDHLRQDDGHIYASPIWAGSNAGGLYTRLDWFTDLGIELPETWEDFGEAHRRILDADPNDRLTAGMGGTSLPGYVIRGYTDGYLLDEVMSYEGDYIVGAFHPGAKEAVRLIASWYEDGVLHPTAIAGGAIGPTEVMRIITDGSIATTAHVALPGHWKTIFEGLAASDPDAQLGFLPLPAGPDGDAYFGGGPGYYGGLVVNSDYSSDMQGRAGEVIDYLLTPEGTELMFDGIEGIHYTMQDGTMVPNEETRNRDFVGSVSNLIDLVDRSIAWEREANRVLADNFYAMDQLAVRPVVTGLASVNYTELSLNVQEVISQYLTRFYSGELDVDRDWSSMTDAMRAAGYDEMLEEVRAFKGM